jgi:hypothetical protein
VERIEVELLTGQHNFAVVRLPQRRFPGVIFQGDSLSVLVADLEDLRDGLRLVSSERDLHDRQEQAALIARRLGDIQATYETALREHEIPLPYAK